MSTSVPFVFCLTDSAHFQVLILYYTIFLGNHLFPLPSSVRLFHTYVIQIDDVVTICLPSWDPPTCFNYLLFTPLVREEFPPYGYGGQTHNAQQRTDDINSGLLITFTLNLGEEGTTYHSGFCGDFTRNRMNTQ